MEVDLHQLSKLYLMVLTDTPPDQVNAIYLFAQPDGVLKEHQIAHAVAFQHRVSKIALCGGTGQGYKGFAEWSEALQERGIPGEKIVAIPYLETLNTYTESIKLVEYAHLQGWKRIIISSLAHHETRVFLTVLKQLQVQEVAMELYLSHSGAIPWWKEVTFYQGEVKMIGHEFIDTEIERLQRYQLIDSLSSVEEGLSYLQQRDTNNQ